MSQPITDALFDAPYEIQSNRCPADDPSFSAPFTTKDFEDAFPGQAVVNGLPNRMRKAMYCAIGLVRAVERNDIEVAFVWMRALHRAMATIKGVS